MTEPTPTPEVTPKLPSPIRCFLGAMVAAALAYAFYVLTQKIGYAFALRPVPTSNQVTYNITIAVRTLIVGMSTLGMGVFGLAALGLFGLGVQVGLQGLKKPTA